ncbi:MAG: hypothetical protein BGO01_06905 [Armatimonadetes bacterium 55-13]|nr:hypothetical protein [Armatimonadota bacterium]OJU62229.1 MAG: hypothetical protein BGO01_06905 [Armatimonadetes bacterium 55-13]
MILTTIIAATVCAQQVPAQIEHARPEEVAGSTGWYTHYQGSASWDPKSVVAFEGRLIGVVQSPKSVDLMVKLKNGGTAFVELGPKRYFDGQAVHLSAKDPVKVSGSKVMVNGESLILCQELRHKGSKIAFRTPDGRPFWNLK